MTDVMNQSIARNTPQMNPSVGTKKTDVSLPVPALVNKVTTTAQIEQIPLPTLPVSPVSQILAQPVSSNNKITSHRVKPTNTKIIIDDEDIDTAIDYDDEEPEI